ncbi:sulfide dehydrogenase subunit alpha [Candidatus Methanoplasma termitum]|uniref:Ferredoxin--NADP reductase n=1 Tax=Candidatus Methanoplasma termitum TaxID=1577791 RepID=A0A0A7LG88_9ARCH|nr:NAD(P)/FAD-dependent oxidoreductase [Candidatus Methanoplasma termitum]AIZ56511.1 sulfide dehydrogenase subunit alpha [Candidatus Methanoplasma termitum]MCL2333247.1 NAD(P)/FAD-dependent oxidoreductase [Candidatus Methanoplasma sp.]
MSYDLIIIGAGPGGLTAGIYARSKMMDTLIIEAGRVGGQLTSLYPEKGIRNYPGFETVQARKLSDRLYAQTESLGCDIREMEKVKEINNGEKELVLVTTKNTYHTKSVIIAIGMGSFHPKKMGCKGEAELTGKGVSYVLPVKEELVGKKVVLFGGGNSAIEMALIADSVTDTAIVHRRAEFRADESNVYDLNHSNIKTIMNTNVVSFNGTDELESITLDQAGKVFDIPADLAVINIGIDSDLTDLKNWGIDLTSEGLVKVTFDMLTNRHGIFACGDVVDYPGKYKQIITACGEAATAVISAYKFVKKPYWA